MFTGDRPMSQIKPKQLNLASAGSLLMGGTNGTGTALAIGTTGQILKVVNGTVSWAAPPSTSEIISPDTFNTAEAENNTGVVISVANSKTNPTQSIPLMTFAAGSPSDENMLLSSSAGELTLSAAGTASDVGITISPKGNGDVTLGNGTGNVIFASTGAAIIQSEDGKDLIVSGGDNSGNLFITNGKNSSSKVYYADDASDAGREVATLNDIKSKVSSLSGRSQFNGTQAFNLPEGIVISSIVASVNGLVVDSADYTATDNGTNVVIAFTKLEYSLDANDDVIFTYNIGG